MCVCACLCVKCISNIQYYKQETCHYINSSSTHKKWASWNESHAGSPRVNCDPAACHPHRMVNAFKCFLRLLSRSLATVIIIIRNTYYIYIYLVHRPQRCGYTFRKILRTRALSKIGAPLTLPMIISTDEFHIKML